MPENLLPRMSMEAEIFKGGKKNYKPGAPFMNIMYWQGVQLNTQLAKQTEYNLQLEWGQ